MECILLIAAITILISCEKENNLDLTEQSAYFEHYSINYAWGLSYVHWIIDNKGYVRVNHKLDSIIWINDDEIDKSICLFDSVIFQVELNELKHYINLIPSVSKGQTVCHDRNRADFGEVVFNCFFNDKIVLISSMTDLEDCYNSNTKAIYVDNWLKNIDAKINSK
jgi:hypothetical protein